jgi:hypothetical protein
MPISQAILQQAARQTHAAAASTLLEAKARGIRTAFLCHSHKDHTLVTGLVNLLHSAGWRVYVDWADSSMPDKPTQETARKIQRKIVDLDYFLFLATANSMASRWCPWEIGYADGTKPNDRILIVPTQDGVTTHGNEYLALHRRIDLSTQGEVAAWKPGASDHGVLIRSL